MLIIHTDTVSFVVVQRGTAHHNIYTKMIFHRKALLAVTCSAGVFFRAAAATEGKSTKGTKNQSNPADPDIGILNSSKGGHRPPVYFLNPSSCPQDCVQCYDYFDYYLGANDPQDGGHGTGEAVQPCDARNTHQMWRFHQKDGLTMIESEYNPGDCLSVVPPEESDGPGYGDVAGYYYPYAYYSMLRVHGTQPPNVLADMCNNGSVGLVSCNHPAAQWISNGANLVSALCWKNGISSFLTVNEGCSELSVMAADDGNDALLRSQTFMLTEQDFIETIVPVSTDEGDSNGSDEMPGQGATGAGALIYPGHESGSVVPAECDPTCANGKVCAKHSSTAAGGECYTKCEDVKCDSDTAGDKCVKGLSTDGIISTDCDCVEAGGGNGGYLWMCKAY